MLKTLGEAIVYKQEDEYINDLILESAVETEIDAIVIGVNDVDESKIAASLDAIPICKAPLVPTTAKDIEKADIAITATDDELIEQEA